MKFRVIINTADVFDKPNGAKVDELLIEDKVDDTGKVESGFMEVVIDAGEPAKWMQVGDLAPVDPAHRQKVHFPTFIEDCINDERTINDLATTAPWFVSADFLIARASIETDVVNAGPVTGGSGAVGPLRVSSAEWNLFRDEAGDVAASYGPDAFDHWLKQIIGAAYRMHRDAKAISDLQVQNGVGTQKDPFLPSNLDVFHAYILNAPDADPAVGAKSAAAIIEAEKSDAGKARKIDEVLLSALGQPKIDALFASRSQFLGTKAAPKTVGEFIAATEKALDDGLKKAFELIKEHAPEELPRLAENEAPWYDAALKKQGLDEHREPDATTIKGFFQHTDFGPAGPGAPPHWCGAFAAFCMATSGSAEAAKHIPKGAAVAARWKGFGDPLNMQSGNIPVGAVVVLKPSEGTGTSGHVGFFARFMDDGKKIELLGGNQSDQVKFSTFLTSRIAYVGWLNLAPTANLPGGAPSATPISDAAVDLIVKAEVSSKQHYDAVLHKPTWPKGASGVTIGIGYDVGHSTPAKLEADWTGRLSAAVINRLKDACGKTGTIARPLAKQMANEGIDVAWEHAMAVFLTRDIPLWVATVERALPNTNELSKDSLGALVSLAYNRGPSFSKDGDRYREMRNIKSHMTNRAFAQIPNEFRSMKRLWPDMRGLRDRRDNEAALFQAGLG